MHTVPGVTEGITFYFHHDDNFSGEVIINIRDDAIWEYKEGPAVERHDFPPEILWPGGYSVRIPFADLKALVAQYVREEHGRRMEESDDDTILMGDW